VLAYSPVNIENSGDFAVNSAYSGFGIRLLTLNGNSPISIENSGNFAVNAAGGATGIFAYSRGAPSSPIIIQNTGTWQSKTPASEPPRHQDICDRKRGED
jgi:hypothetical protein